MKQPCNHLKPGWTEGATGQKLLSLTFLSSTAAPTREGANVATSAFS